MSHVFSSARSSLAFFSALLVLAGTTALVGCGSDAAPGPAESTPPAPPGPAEQQNLDAFVAKTTIDAQGNVHTDKPAMLSVSAGSLEDTLRSVAPPERPIICGGGQDWGGRVCCTATQCCVNVSGQISCF